MLIAPVGMLENVWVLDSAGSESSSSEKAAGLRPPPPVKAKCSFRRS